MQTDIDEKCGACAECEWQINAPEYDNCFWILLEQRSNNRGQMPVMSHAEIGAMLGINYGKVTEIFKAALEKMQEFDQFEDMIELYKD